MSIFSLSLDQDRPSPLSDGLFREIGGSGSGGGAEEAVIGGFLPWDIQLSSVMGRRTGLVAWCWAKPLLRPVEEVRGGMALGEGKVEGSIFLDMLDGETDWGEAGIQ